MSESGALNPGTTGGMKKAGGLLEGDRSSRLQTCLFDVVKFCQNYLDVQLHQHEEEKRKAAC